MGAAASSALKGPGKGGNKDGEKNKQPSQHQQWRKPKDLKEIKKQNEQRRKEQEELEKRRKEAEEKLRKQKELLEQERKRLETAEEIDGAEVGDYVAGQTTAGNTASSPELSQNNDNYGAGAAGQNGEQNYNFNPDYVFFDDQTGKYIAYDYDEQGNIINMQDVSVHYETAAEKALKKAEQVGIFDIMEHEEVVPSEYVKNQERKEIEERLKQDEMKRSKQNEILQLRQREVKTGSIFGNPKRNSDVLNASQLGSSQKSIGTNNSLRSSQLSLNNTQDKQVLQLQDELVSKHEKLKLPENMSLENTLIDAANKIWEQIIRENKSRRAELNASGGLGPPGSTLTQPQNNTTNATSQRTSTRPSQNNNNSPAKANFGNDLNNPNDPTILLTLKKQVEEAAHSLEAYENDLETYAQQKYALIHELDQLVLKIEPNAILGYNEQLETAYEFVEGEFAIRKGKLCTIHKIHHQELPPYYEVKPYYHNENLTNNFTMNQNIIGTEATKLKALGPVQAGQVRAKMRSIDVIESKVVVADEGKRNAEQDLVMNHKKLEELFQAMKLGKDNPPANPGPPVTLPIPMLPTQPQQPVDLNMTRTRGIAAQNIPRPVSSRPKWKPGMGPVNMPSIEVVKKWAQPGMQDYSPPHNQMESDNVNLNQNYSQNNYGGPGAGQHYNSANPTTQYQYQQVQGGAGIYTSPVTRNSSASNSKEKEKEREQLIFQHGEKMRQEEYMRQEEQRSSRKNSKSQNSVPTTGGFGLPSMEKMQADRAKMDQQQQQQQTQQAQQQQQAAQQQQQAGKTKWIPYSTEDGNVFYYSEQTGESVWELPANAEVDYSNCENDTNVEQQRQKEEDEYYQQYGYANRQAYEDAWYKAEAEKQAKEQQKIKEQKQDPFYHLRQHEQQQAQQQAEWAEWYKQYQAWYAGSVGGQQHQHNQQQNNPYGNNSSQPFVGNPYQNQQNTNAGYGAQQQRGPHHNANSPGGPQHQQNQRPPTGGTPNLPPGVRDPKLKPILDPQFEDRAVYLMKAGILKEMELMVQNKTSIEDRKKALRKLKFQWHPDKNPEDPEVAKSVFQFVEECKIWFLLDEEEGEGGTSVGGKSPI